MKKTTIPEQLNLCLMARKFPALGRSSDQGLLWTIAKNMVSKGHSVTILAARSPLGEHVIQRDNVTAYYLLEGKNNTHVKKFPELAKKQFFELHQQRPFHLVHSIDDSAKRIAKIKKDYKVAVCYDVAATQMSQLFSILGMAQETLPSLIRTGLSVTYKFLRTYYGKDRPLLKSADGIFVTSPMQRIALERYYLYPDSRTFTVPYGLEIGDLQPKEQSEDLRKLLHIPQQSQTVVTVTDMSEWEELKNLLVAFQKVAIKLSNARLVIVGTGPLKKQIEFETYSLALGGRVIFAGNIPSAEIPEYISLGSVFVNLSSRTSGYEPVMLEAMAQEKVIIGSEVSPISTVVEDGKDGFLIRPADVGSLASLMLDIFTENLETAEIGQRARKKVLNLFDTDKMVRQTLEAYNQILNRTGYYL